MKKKKTEVTTKETPTQRGTLPQTTLSASTTDRRRVIPFPTQFVNANLKIEAPMAAICAPLGIVKNWALGSKTKFPDTHGGEIEKKCQRERCLNIATAYLTKYPQNEQNIQPIGQILATTSSFDTKPTWTRVLMKIQSQGTNRSLTSLLSRLKPKSTTCRTGLSREARFDMPYVAIVWDQALILT